MIKENDSRTAVVHEAIGSDLLLPAEAAALMRVKPTSLAVWRCVKRHSGLRYVKIGNRIFYRRCDVETFIRAHLVGGAADSQAEAAAAK